MYLTALLKYLKLYSVLSLKCMEKKFIFLSKVTSKKCTESKTEICCGLIKISGSGWIPCIRQKCTQCVLSTVKLKPFLLVHVIIQFIASCRCHSMQRMSFPWQEIFRPHNLYYLFLTYLYAFFHRQIYGFVW